MSDSKLRVVEGSFVFPQPIQVTEMIEYNIKEHYNSDPEKIFKKLKNKPEYKNAIKRLYISEKKKEMLRKKVAEILQSAKNDEEKINQIIEYIVMLENEQAVAPYGKLIGFLTPPQPS